jgi:uncharacterized membrane protein
MWLRTLTARILEALKIRKRLFMGIITIVPMAVTAWVIYILGANFHKIFKPVISRLLHIESAFLGFCISFLLMLLIIYVIGFLSTFLAVKRLLSIGEKILSKIPFVKALYSSTRQAMDIISMPHAKVFQKVVIIEYPRKGFHTIGFVTGETIVGDSREKLVSVFMPTTPNPTTGFVFLLPESELRETDLSVSEGMRILFSGGVLMKDTIALKRYISDLQLEAKTTNLQTEG